MRYAKVIVLIMIIAILLSIFASCSENAESSEADTYLNMAQEFVNKGNYDGAIDILQKGLDETGDQRISERLSVLITVRNNERENETMYQDGTEVTEGGHDQSNEETQSESETPNKQDTSDLKTYEGTWAQENIDWEYGGMILDVNITDSSIVSAEILFVQSAPDSRSSTIDLEIPVNDIVDGVFETQFEDDGWGNAGSLTISFDETCIICEIYDTYYAGDGVPVWGISEGVTTLIRNDTAHEAIVYSEDDYNSLYPAETQAPTYDMSKASGIFASMNVTEEEFRTACQPISITHFKALKNELITTTDIRNYPSLYAGQLFYLSNNDGNEPGSDHYNPTFLHIDYKGVADGITMYMVTPNAESEVYLMLYDCRDDIYAPTISEGDYIKPYMIFLEVRTVDGIDFVVFKLVSMDKR